MMTEAEMQMVSYAAGILRSHGYVYVADDLAGVIGTESDRRARLLAPPPPMEWRATG